MECKKCGKHCEEGFGYDGKNWVLLDIESNGVELLDVFCRDCVEKALNVLIDETADKIRNVS